MANHETLTGTAIHEAFHYIQATDPGAVGASKYWLDTTTEPYVLKRRNAGNSDWVTVGSAGSFLNDYICIVDQKAQNTAGGTFTSGAWQTRDLNTERSDTGGHASVASNQITLAAGTYIVHASAPAHAVNWHQARLQNITDASTILEGTSEAATTASSVTSRSVVVGKFTLVAQKVVELQHRCTVTKTTNGYGLAANFTNEIYSVVELWKVA